MTAQIIVFSELLELLLEAILEIQVGFNFRLLARSWKTRWLFSIDARSVFESH
jgi:hypothetical protein